MFDVSAEFPAILVNFDSSNSLKIQPKLQKSLIKKKFPTFYLFFLFFFYRKFLSPRAYYMKKEENIEFRLNPFRIYKFRIKDLI